MKLGKGIELMVSLYFFAIYIEAVMLLVSHRYNYQHFKIIPIV